MRVWKVRVAIPAGQSKFCLWQELIWLQEGSCLRTLWHVVSQTENGQVKELRNTLSSWHLEKLAAQHLGTCTMMCYLWRNSYCFIARGKKMVSFGFIVKKASIPLIYRAMLSTLWLELQANLNRCRNAIAAVALNMLSIQPLESRWFLQRINGW